jgi:hypothetical protein
VTGRRGHLRGCFPGSPRRLRAWVRSVWSCAGASPIRIRMSTIWAKSRSSGAGQPRPVRGPCVLPFREGGEPARRARCPERRTEPRSAFRSAWARAFSGAAAVASSMIRHAISGRLSTGLRTASRSRDGTARTTASHAAHPDRRISAIASRLLRRSRFCGHPRPARGIELFPLLLRRSRRHGRVLPSHRQ